MESQHMTQQTFANFIEMSPGTLSSIFNGRTQPTLKIVEAIKNKLPSMNLDWLLFGKGTMFDNQSQSIDEITNLDVKSTGEAMLDFGPHSSTPSYASTDVQNLQGVNRTPNNLLKTEVKYIDKPQRKITEIRVYFDDQTWESFVSKK